MKHIRSAAINLNLKWNHTKKYQHNINIITFLKSNYKYKRRCTITGRRSGSDKRRQQVWRQNQTHSLPVAAEKILDYGIIQNISLCMTKQVSKFPRIFISIMQSTTTTTSSPPNVPPPLPATKTDSSGLTESLPAPEPSSLFGCIQKNGFANRALAAGFANSTVNNVSDGIRRQCNAYKDANEDTNFGGSNHATNLNDDATRRCHVGDKMHYQHGNYDKVSTITSTPPLRCHRQKKHHQQHHQQQQTPAKFPTLSSPLVPATWPSPSPLPDRTNSDETGCCFTTTLRHYCHRNHPNHHAMHTKLPPFVFAALHDSELEGDMSTHHSVKSMAHAWSCQSVEQSINIGSTNRIYSTMSLFLTLFIAFTIGVHAAAGESHQTSAIMFITLI